MRRVLLDTNIYGELAIDKELTNIIKNIQKRKDVIASKTTIGTKYAETISAIF